MLNLDFSSSVFCDGLLTNQDGELLFLSVWGRDTDITELLARLTLPDHPDGIRSFTAKGEGYAMKVVVPNPKLLDKQQGRASGSVFGELIQLFVFARSLQQPDRVSREAWALFRVREDQPDIPDVWPLVMETCHVPLLPQWRDPVLAAFRYRGWISQVAGYRMGALGVHLGDDNVELCIEDLVRTRQIGLSNVI